MENRGDFGAKSIPDVILHPLTADDLVMLCSDGLSGYCTDSEIEHVMQDNYRDVTACSDQLLQLAMQAGGHDNICIVLASLIGDEQDAPTEVSRPRSWRDGIRRLLNL